MLLNRLKSQGLIHPPQWLPSTTHYLCLMGSVAYGVSGDDSDSDIYGFCVPPKEMVFPHLAGEIQGFGRQIKRFEQWQEHHIRDVDAGKEYDFQVYNIVKYFQLSMENNPNMCDALFVPERCVIHCNAIGNMVRENRKLFLHRGCWHKFRGYAYSMVHKMSIKNPEEGSKRCELIRQFGMDTKYAYHVVRLVYEVEQMLTTGDLDLESNSETLKAIRRGEWTEQRVIDFFAQKEKALNKAYEESILPYAPDESKIKKLLLECLEHHFGSLDKAYVEPDRYKNALLEIQEICAKLRMRSRCRPRLCILESRNSPKSSWLSRWPGNSSRTNGSGSPKVCRLGRWRPS